MDCGPRNHLAASQNCGKFYLTEAAQAKEEKEFYFKATY
jgi:hypothetical protein